MQWQVTDIPEKMHLFYEQAFDTLFARHDALKESFKRDMHSGLSIDVFKRYFSYFCLVSYYDSKIEFTEVELRSYIMKGLKIDDAKVNVDNFIKDLTESVCAVQRDGLNFVFTHRTFQEFFTAYCLSRIPLKHFRPLVSHVAGRTSDNVLPMLREMNDSLLEVEFLLPDLQEFLDRFDADTTNDFLYKYSRNGVISCRSNGRGAAISFAESTHTLRTLKLLFAADYSAIEKGMPKFKRKDALAIGDASDAWNRKLGKTWAAAIAIDPAGKCLARVHSANGNSLEEQADWMQETGFRDYAAQDIVIARKIALKLSQKSSKKDTAIDKIFAL